MTDQAWESTYKGPLPGAPAQANAGANETSSGGAEPVRWVRVAVALGPAHAEILRGRLEAEGIPARVLQEPAGSVYGLTVGLLGQIDVVVPQEYAAQARDLLASETEMTDEDVEEE
ncbi:MAG: hypothetical protein C4309_02195 [Chloroflexota bacterium]